MIAIDLNGTIKTFFRLPKVWNDENGTHLNITNGQAFGFYSVVTPTIKQSEQLGDIYFDAEAEVFTYSVELKTYSETLEELKESKISELKNIYNRVLQATDWYIVRAAEGGTSTPQEILDARTAYRNECLTKEAEIQALTTKVSIIDYELPEF